MRLVAILIACLMIFACKTVPVAPAQPIDYGPYPHNYKEIILEYHSRKLNDPLSAKYRWVEEPKKYYIDTPYGPRYGWQIFFKINAKNRFGGYTGEQFDNVIIRNGKVI